MNWLGADIWCGKVVVVGAFPRSHAQGVRIVVLIVCVWNFLSWDSGPRKYAVFDLVVSAAKVRDNDKLLVQQLLNEGDGARWLFDGGEYRRVVTAALRHGRS